MFSHKQESLTMMSNLPPDTLPNCRHQLAWYNSLPLAQLGNHNSGEQIRRRIDRSRRPRRCAILRWPHSFANYFTLHTVGISAIHPRSCQSLPRGYTHASINPRRYASPTVQLNTSRRFLQQPCPRSTEGETSFPLGRRSGGGIGQTRSRPRGNSRNLSQWRVDATRTAVHHTAARSGNPDPAGGHGAYAPSDRGRVDGHVGQRGRPPSATAGRRTTRRRRSCAVPIAVIINTTTTATTSIIMFSSTFRTKT
jgi:hypothetical protein